jgi:hypothetical protein
MPFPSDAPLKIRERLDRGTLPHEPPGKMYAGHGENQLCDGCDEPIGPSQVQYEFDADGRTIRFHLGCAGLWEAYRRRYGWDHPPSEPSR